MLHIHIYIWCIDICILSIYIYMYIHTWSDYTYTCIYIYIHKIHTCEFHVVLEMLKLFYILNISKVINSFILVFRLCVSHWFHLHICLKFKEKRQFTYCICDHEVCIHEYTYAARFVWRCVIQSVLINMCWYIWPTGHLLCTEWMVANSRPRWQMVYPCSSSVLYYVHTWLYEYIDYVDYISLIYEYDWIILIYSISNG